MTMKLEYKVYIYTKGAVYYNGAFCIYKVKYSELF